LVNPPQDQIPDRGVTQLGAVQTDHTTTIHLLNLRQIGLFESSFTPSFQVTHTYIVLKDTALRPRLWSSPCAFGMVGQECPAYRYRLDEASHPLRSPEQATTHPHGAPGTAHGNIFRNNRLRLLPVVGEALIQITAIKLHKGQGQKPNRRHHSPEGGPEIHRTSPIAVKFFTSSIRTLTKTFTSSRN